MCKNFKTRKYTLKHEQIISDPFFFFFYSLRRREQHLWSIRQLFQTKSYFVFETYKYTHIYT